MNKYLETYGTISTKRELINHLYGLADESIIPINEETGLCDHIFRVDLGCGCGEYGIHNPINIDKYMESWFYYSGYPNYPVPPSKSPKNKEEGLRESEVSSIYMYTDNMWDDNIYGNLRRDLCRHIAKELEKELTQLVN